MQLPPEIESRFWSKVDRKGPDECWLWRTAVDRYGYGQFHMNRTNNRAHRMAFQLAVRLLASNELALHRCDVPACCNPAHLFPGSAKDNSDDMIRKGRSRSPRGDDHYTRRRPDLVRRGEKSANSKVTAEQVMTMRSEYQRGGVKQKDLAVKYGISKQQASLILRGDSWTHLE